MTAEELELLARQHLYGEREGTPEWMYWRGVAVAAECWQRNGHEMYRSWIQELPKIHKAQR